MVQRTTHGGTLGGPVNVGSSINRHRENFSCFTGPKINVLQLFPILNMVIQRSFIGPPIFFTGPPTFSSVEDRGLTSFAESALKIRVNFKLLHHWHMDFRMFFFCGLHTIAYCVMYLRPISALDEKKVCMSILIHKWYFSIPTYKHNIEQYCFCIIIQYIVPLCVPNYFWTDWPFELVAIWELPAWITIYRP